MQPKDDIDKINFNPRLREGGDVLQSSKVLFKAYFNPRLREGGDMLLFWKLPV